MKKVLFIFMSLMFMGLSSAAYENATYNWPVTGTYTGFSDANGMAFNITTGNTMTIAAVLKKPTTVLSTVCVYNDTGRTQSNGCANFYGDIAIFSTPLNLVSRTYYLLPQAGLVYDTAYATGRTYPQPSSNTILRFVAGINTGGYVTTEAYAFAAIYSTYQNNLVGFCDELPGSTYINFTFKDEKTLANLKGNLYGSSVTSTFAGVSSSTSTSNSSNMTTKGICANPGNQTYSVTGYITYSDGGNYPQRRVDFIDSFTNISVEKTLYLLSSSYGQYVTFQIINAADQPLEDVFVVLNKSISGSQTTISSGYTGADGGITFWLNPDDQYTISAYLSPYPSYSTTQAFTQDSYTITLGSNTAINVSDYNKGISYSFKPSGDWLNNNTIYNFNLSLTSSYWALQEFGFNITNGSGYYLGQSNSTATTGGVTSLNLNTGANRTLIATYYWKINNVTTQFKRTYRILDLSKNQYSLTRLLSDFNSYSSSGLFGLTEFGKGLIIFFIIVGTVGTAKVKFGISDESTLAGLLFAIVALFDVGFNLIPNPVGAISYFPTIVIGIIFAGFAIKELRTA